MAIKAVRSMYDIGLKEAKFTIDLAERYSSMTDSEPF